MKYHGDLREPLVWRQENPVFHSSCKLELGIALQSLQKLETEDFGFTQQRYDAGIISKLDLIQMKESLLTVNQLVASSTVDCYVDYISLYKAVGSKL